MTTAELLKQYDCGRTALKVEEICHCDHMANRGWQPGKEQCMDSTMLGEPQGTSLDKGAHYSADPFSDDATETFNGIKV